MYPCVYDDQIIGFLNIPNKGQPMLHFAKHQGAFVALRIERIVKRPGWALYVSDESNHSVTDIQTVDVVRIKQDQIGRLEVLDEFWPCDLMGNEKWRPNIAKLIQESGTTKNSGNSTLSKS